MKKRSDTQAMNTVKKKREKKRKAREVAVVGHFLFAVVMC